MEAGTNGLGEGGGLQEALPRGNLAGALRVFRGAVRGRGCRPNVVTYGSLLSLCGRCAAAATAARLQRVPKPPPPLPPAALPLYTYPTPPPRAVPCTETCWRRCRISWQEGYVQGSTAPHAAVAAGSVGQHVSLQGARVQHVRVPNSLRGMQHSRAGPCCRVCLR